MAGSCSAFGVALETMKHVKTQEGEMLTKEFLDVCRNVLPVIDKFGTSMAMVKNDVGGNIGRLDAHHASDPVGCNLLYDIVSKEIADKKAKESSSCSNGLLWLTRAMDFLVELFRNLLSNPDWTMTQCASASYISTLKKFHGWIASAAFTVAMKLVPDRSKFEELLGGGNLNDDIKNFVTGFAPILQEIHTFLRSVALDDMKTS